MPAAAGEVRPIIRDGRRLGQIVRPLDSMGAYIPAGRYPLPSTLLMNVIPAQVAGVQNDLRRLSATQRRRSWASRHGWASTHLFRMGGAQAIAALAFGTETVPRVDRIVGPGNIYVAAAKKLIAGETGIDFVAGPTEIVIIAAEGNARWIAADMLAQAEHDVDASAILLTTSRTLAERVAAEVDRQLETLPTARWRACHRSTTTAPSSLSTRWSEAVEFSNALAPEHLALHDASLLSSIQNAGSVFLGPLSPEAAGDYASGPNHVLPTSGAARMRGGLSSADFVKVISVQELSTEALAHSRRPSRRWRAPKVWKRTRAPWRCAVDDSLNPALQPREAVLRMAPYSPPTGGRAGKLRLDFNENTVGCSPRVIEFLHDYLPRDRLAIYPEYADAKRGLAGIFRRRSRRVHAHQRHRRSHSTSDQHLRR